MFTPGGRRPPPNHDQTLAAVSLDRACRTRLIPWRHQSLRLFPVTSRVHLPGWDGGSGARERASDGGAGVEHRHIKRDGVANRQEDRPVLRKDSRRCRLVQSRSSSSSTVLSPSSSTGRSFLQSDRRRGVWAGRAAAAERGRTGCAVARLAAQTRRPGRSEGDLRITVANFFSGATNPLRVY